MLVRTVLVSTVGKYSTGAVLGASTTSVLRQYCHIVLAHYWSPVLGQSLFPVLRQYCNNAANQY